mmetsp:Transcript_29891/g.47932  ORF Transcript_29891/g.47932 Transcript_29891/m.47932 type:complete len:88 (+) Transcript_29891:181-444(+)
MRHIDILSVVDLLHLDMPDIPLMKEQNRKRYLHVPIYRKNSCNNPFSYYLLLRLFFFIIATNSTTADSIPLKFAALIISLQFRVHFR